MKIYLLTIESRDSYASHIAYDSREKARAALATHCREWWGRTKGDWSSHISRIGALYPPSDSEDLLIQDYFLATEDYEWGGVEELEVQ